MSSHEKNINRREFIARTALIAVAVSMPVLNSCNDNSSDPLVHNDCETTSDILGPFYKSGAPFQEDITPAENTGAPFIIQGKVFGSCETTLQNAIVEIWNADTYGVYDTATFKFRGQFKTEQDGAYRFKTIIPGRYLNGELFRPSHIHFRITAPAHQELVSQIYFKDDPYIPTDPWASNPKASERILTIGKDVNNTDTVNFDIYLNPIA